jgi:hypothetical protein
MRKISIIVLLGVVLLLPNPLLADCTNLAGYTSWVLEGDNKIIFYRGSNPIASITLKDCKVTPNSNIRLIKGYVCESDKIVIDGETCNIMSLDIL